VTLRELLETAAARLDEASTGVDREGEMTWSRSGAPFAVLHGDGAGPSSDSM
jgi:hypothetical protein